MDKPKCAVDECPRPIRKRQFCNRHYENLRKYGNPVPQRDRSLETRLREVGWTITASGCWEWNGKRNEHGYGIFSVKRLGFDGVRAHRVMYEHLKEPIPAGLVLRHNCDNPPCVNPEHLVPGTVADNVTDMMVRGRHWRTGRTECDNGHDLTVAGATKAVTTRRGPQTLCVECDRDRKRRYSQRKRAS